MITVSHLFSDNVHIGISWPRHDDVWRTTKTFLAPITRLYSRMLRRLSLLLHTNSTIINSATFFHCFFHWFKFCKCVAKTMFHHHQLIFNMTQASNIYTRSSVSSFINQPFNIKRIWYFTTYTVPQKPTLLWHAVTSTDFNKFWQNYFCDHHFYKLLGN